MKYLVVVLALLLPSAALAQHHMHGGGFGGFPGGMHGGGFGHPGFHGGFGPSFHGGFGPGFHHHGFHRGFYGGGGYGYGYSYPYVYPPVSPWCYDQWGRRYWCQGYGDE